MAHIFCFEILLVVLLFFCRGDEMLLSGFVLVVNSNHMNERQKRYSSLPLHFPGCIHSIQHHSKGYRISKTTKNKLFASPNKLSVAEQERLLFSDKGITAFIVAEVEHFVNSTMVGLDTGTEFVTKWKCSPNEKVQLGLMDENGVLLDTAYTSSCEELKGDRGGALAVAMLCNTTQEALQHGFQEKGLFSSLGSAIMFFRSYYRTPHLIAACERVGLSDYQVAHHITDMYHHVHFRGAYTKTLAASGKGEVAARIAVGLVDDAANAKDQNKKTPKSSVLLSEDEEEIIDDECLVWSPTDPNACIHWKSDNNNEKSRKTRFERIQMEGTKDPRRGGSGTTR